VAGRVDAAPARPFPQHVTLTPGTILPDHRPRAQLDDDVRVLYDAWKSRYLAQAGTDAAGRPRHRVRVARDANARTVSEGQGFGMLIVPLLAGHDPDAQTIFDGLWQFARDHRSTIDGRLMAWSVPANEAPDAAGNDSAFDGDADIAFGLLLAEAQWGNGGRFDYGAEATWVIGGIAASTIGPTSRLPLLGDWVDPEGTPYSQWTPRTSDFMLDNFRAFGWRTGDPLWTDVVAAAQAAVTRIQAVYSPGTGLLPDFLEPLGASDTRLRRADAGFLEGPHDGHYAYNAVRDPFRIGIDAARTGDPVSRAQAGAIADWARGTTGGDPQVVRATRRLDGTLVSGADYVTSVFVAPLGVAAMSTSQQAWLNALYDATRTSDEGYLRGHGEPPLPPRHDGEPLEPDGAGAGVRGRHPRRRRGVRRRQHGAGRLLRSDVPARAGGLRLRRRRPVHDRGRVRRRRLCGVARAGARLRGGARRTPDAHGAAGTSASAGVALVGGHRRGRRVRRPGGRRDEPCGVRLRRGGAPAPRRRARRRHLRCAAVLEGHADRLALREPDGGARRRARARAENGHESREHRAAGEGRQPGAARTPAVTGLRADRSAEGERRRLLGGPLHGAGRAQRRGDLRRRAGLTRRSLACASAAAEAGWRESSSCSRTPAGEGRTSRWGAGHRRKPRRGSSGRSRSRDDRKRRRSSYAATSLARLWRRGKAKEAAAVLSEVYGRFDEGFDTRELREARALLADLRHGSGPRQARPRRA
jgi:hypothetical protein